MLKRILMLISLSGLIVLVGYSTYEYTSFTIVNSERGITGFIQEHLGQLEKKPLLLETYPIEYTNKVVATFEHNEKELGAVIFQKGFYGKLKPEKVLLDRSFYSEIINTKKGTFILFIGENKQTSIQTIETDIVSSGERVKLAVPPQKYFSLIRKMDHVSKIESEPNYIYRTLKGAISGVADHMDEMELMFVDEDHQSFLIYSEEDSILKTVLGVYHYNDYGFEVTGMEKPNFYSMKEEKDFCFEEKNVKADNAEHTYIHGLVPKKEEIQKVVLEVERKEEVIYQISSNVVENQFLLHVSLPELPDGDGKLIKKFHLYDKEGKYVRTELKAS
ncbi:hypothetical protein FZC74_01000 [Sutcliffiella horikoshii]|uniref:Uncharacterized protein n=1 Tax=Sutcliffiella horikoshii TaxID=79883 RepID=A0AA95B8E5_9BACI|nr:hypothetical protein [Sutcliffiella horikoshii]TYS60891.1 hypothetical protein FZC74_01000 [Sutcliffiella horikoshii]